jgi:hypothetical protein
MLLLGSGIINETALRDDTVYGGQADTVLLLLAQGLMAVGGHLASRGVIGVIGHGDSKAV